MKSGNIIKQKSFDFSIRIVRLYQHLSVQKKEFTLSKQLIRCGTSIGANIYEALQGSSTKDFINKLNISLKEAHETQYWLNLLFATGYLSKEENISIENDCIELIKFSLLSSRQVNPKPMIEQIVNYQLSIINYQLKKCA